MRNKDIQRLPVGYHPGASYDNPLIHSDGSTFHQSNAWCWECRTYTAHSFRDNHKRGVGERQCMNCGKEYALATNVTRFDPEFTADFIDYLNFQMANW